MARDSQESTPKKNPFIFKWVVPLFLKPRKTSGEIGAEEKPVWLTPLVIVSALILLMVLFTGPVRREAIQSGANLPADFQYYSVEQQQQFLDAQARQTSVLFLTVFPLLKGWLGLWASWFILGSVLHLSLTLAGSRAANVRSLNLVGWSFLPIGLRHLAGLLAALIGRSLVTSPGLSGFVATGAKGLSAYAGAFIGLIDVYFIFQVVFLFLGVVPLAGISRTKAWVACGISLLVLMLLQSLPGFLTAALSGFSMSGIYF